MDFLDQLKPFIHWLHLNPGWAGFVTFLISLGESLALVGLLIPGSVIMTAIGTLIGAKVIPGSPIILCAILGAILGDGISYRLGYHYNEQLRDKWPFRPYPSLLKKSETFFETHGGKSVFLGRFVGPIRPIIPLVAGMTKMKPSRFFVSNVISGILWAPVYMLPGIIVGIASLELEPKYATRLILFVLVALAFIWLTTWLFKRIIHGMIAKKNAGLNALWRYFKKHPFYRPLYLALQDPNHPDEHGQLGMAISFLILVGVLTTFFVGLFHYQSFYYINDATHSFFQSLHVPLITKLMIGITLFGYRLILLSTTFICACYLAFKQRWRACLHLLLAVIITGCTVFIFKSLIHSPRPPGANHIGLMNSFPSGHTTLSIAFYSFFAVLIARNLSPLKQRWIYTATTILCIAIIISRLYLGAHWLTDVVGGSLIGLAIVFPIIISYRRKASPRVSSRHLGVIFLTSILSLWCWSLVHNYKELHHRYEVTWPDSYMSVRMWWNKLARKSPQFRASRTGKPLQLFNIQWADTIENIQKTLQADGWQKQPDFSFSTLVSRLITDEKTSQLPLLPPLYRGHAPTLVFTKQGPEQHHLLLINLWPSNIIFTNDDVHPLWLGTINYQMPRGHKFWAYNIHKKQQDSFVSPTLQLMPVLDEFKWKQLHYATKIKPKKMPYSEWRGGVLIIRSKKK